MFAGNNIYITFAASNIKRANDALVRRLTPTATACHRPRWCERGKEKK